MSFKLNICKKVLEYLLWESGRLPCFLLASFHHSQEEWNVAFGSLPEKGMLNDAVVNLF